MNAGTAHRSARTMLLGLGLVVVASASFGTSGAFAKALLLTGWTPAGVVTWRVGMASLVLVPVAAWAIRGRWYLLRRNAGAVTAFGLVAVAGCQFAYFNAVETLSIAVALLLEYLGSVMVVGWLWARHGRRPSRVTLAGVALSVLGLVLVLDVFSGVEISWVGVVWGLLAAVGLATFYVASSHDHDESLPPLALAGFGLGVGAVALVLASATGLIDYGTARESVQIAGLTTAWWVPIAELAVVAAALAYGVGVMGTRLVGATVASFVGLSEVLFAIAVAWLLLDELPGWIQLAGGLLILAGVVAVKLGEAEAGAGAGDGVAEGHDDGDGDDDDDDEDRQVGGRTAYRQVASGSHVSGEPGRQADWPAPHPVA